MQIIPVPPPDPGMQRVSEMMADLRKRIVDALSMPTELRNFTEPLPSRFKLRERLTDWSNSRLREEPVPPNYKAFREHLLGQVED
ncbi:MAG: hypothetical protein KGL39_23165 [Patescibacteria group bacterium]|nr:hypothetical protein [Patescibacteria group bacterium]